MLSLCFFEGGTGEPTKFGQQTKSHGVTKPSNQSTNKNQSNKTGAQSGGKKQGTQSSQAEKTGSEAQSSQSNKPPKVRLKIDPSHKKIQQSRFPTMFNTNGAVHSQKARRL